MSVDVRTRTTRPEATVDPEDFFERDLPAALDRNGPPAAVRALAPPPLTIEVDGSAWTLTAEDGRVAVVRGSQDGARLRLTTSALDGLVHDEITPMAWFSSGVLDLTNGRLERVLDWWMILRAALDEREPYVGGGMTFESASGAPLDLGHTFTLDDDPATMREFLEQCGYLHIAGVYSEEEMARVSADMDRAAPGYSEGDGRSWWAKTADGTSRLVRMQSFDDESPTVAELVRDDRLRTIGALPGDGHEWGASRSDNWIEALVKPIGVVEGISDVPWHKDCAFGRHSYQCCGLTVGISVTGADATCGQLRVVAGSHRALVWPALFRRDLDLPVVDLPTRTGDATVHLSCTLHMAQPPTDRERRVLYTGFSLPPNDRAADLRAREELRAIREAAPVTVSQPPAAPVR
ncbi:MAG TPA: phytanoyl-CoA dioxygenase family protein [Acidimicrobiia bacterium]